MSIIDSDVKVAVSSVLNRDVKQYGKKFMFDNNGDTCWNSDQGKDQWVKLAFSEEKNLDKIQLKMQFQGGFSCRVCTISLLNEENTEIVSTNCYPEDVNSMQSFNLEFSVTSDIKFKCLKLQFKDTTDFFGRITIYSLDVMKVT